MRLRFSQDSEDRSLESLGVIEEMFKGKCVMEPRAARRTALFLTGFFLAANLFASVVDGAGAPAQKRRQSRQSKSNKSTTQKWKTSSSLFSHQTHSVAQK